MVALGIDFLELGNRRRHALVEAIVGLGRATSDAILVIHSFEIPRWVAWSCGGNGALGIAGHDVAIIVLCHEVPEEAPPGIIYDFRMSLNQAIVQLRLCGA